MQLYIKDRRVVELENIHTTSQVLLHTAAHSAPWQQLLFNLLMSWSDSYQGLPSAVSYLHFKHLAPVCAFPPAGNWSVAVKSFDHFRFKIGHYKAKNKLDYIVGAAIGGTHRATDVPTVMHLMLSVLSMCVCGVCCSSWCVSASWRVRKRLCSFCPKSWIPVSRKETSTS